MRPKLLIANPNTSCSVTDRLVAVAQRLAGPRAEIIGATAPFGATALETTRDIEIAKLAVLAMAGAHEEVDGILVAAFGDPGLSTLRAVRRVPVQGLGEAGLLAAAQAGKRFAILTLGPSLKTAIEEKVRTLSLSSRLAAIRFLDCGVLDLAAEPARYHDDILHNVRFLKEETRAEAVLLAGAPFCGLAGELRSRACAPLYDGLDAGIGRLLLPFV